MMVRWGEFNHKGTWKELVCKKNWGEKEKIHHPFKTLGGGGGGRGGPFFPRKKNSKGKEKAFIFPSEMGRGGKGGKKRKNWHLQSETKEKEGEKVDRFQIPSRMGECNLKILNRTVKGGLERERLNRRTIDVVRERKKKKRGGKKVCFCPLVGQFDFFFILP